MQQYLDLCQQVLDKGIWKPNRTGMPTIGLFGEMLKFDLADGFPMITTKKVPWKMVVGEMLGFLRGYDTASDFRKLGVTIWDQNANENSQWLANPNRKGVDDLGRIYGVQARGWLQYEYGLADSGSTIGEFGYQQNTIDQLGQVVNKLNKGIDDRRLIVTHWNPGEIPLMALPPCHLLYQFNIEGNRLNLLMYQRSCDLPLGVPFNIAGYAWLLSVIAHITGYQPGVFTHFLGDAHIYKNQVIPLYSQLDREPFPLPKLRISPEVSSLEFLEIKATQEHFILEGYKHHSAIKYPFSV